MKTRGFEVAKGFENYEINLPERQTKCAAGYDFEAAEDTLIPSIWSILARQLKLKVCYSVEKDKNIIFYLKEGDNKKVFKPTLVKTGVKSYMPNDEYLQLVNRSSNPMKNFLLMSNGIGVIDGDYYCNESNDGHIMFQFINYGLKEKLIKKGERIGQGIFLKFLKSDQELQSNKIIVERVGGFGSTEKESL